MTEIAEMQLLRKGEDNQTLNLNPITAPALIISVTSGVRHFNPKSQVSHL